MIRKIRPYHGMMILFVIIMTWSISAFTSFMGKSQEKSADSIRKSLLKACIQCYALEGSYPESLKYLSEHYGVQLDEEKYFYYYEIVASNLSPTINVIPRGR